MGSAPDYREFPNGNHEPRRLLRLNVYFDNPIPRKDGEAGRGGFWAPVELHRDAEPRCSRMACGCWSRATRCATKGRMPTRTCASRSSSRPGAWASCGTASTP
ncbi:hypothetical protein [Cupriavidus sp. DF5525]|uniref:hypothetical protein n=1 Tax=Cupriavidus sp. DF5525 TaxID=3160989 RepID=UPI00345F41D5